MSEAENTEVQVDDTPKWRPVDVDAAETDAREQGWVDLREWQEQGKDPENHVDPYTYVQRGRAMEGRNKAQSEAQRLQAELKQQRDATNEMLAFQKRTLETQLKKELKEAVDNGDHEAAERVTGEMANLSKPAAPPVVDRAAIEREVNEWRRDNNQLLANPQQYAVVEAIDSNVESFGIPRDLPVRERLDRCVQVAKLQRPELFPGSAPRGPDSGGRATPRQSDAGKWAWSKLSEGERIEGKRIAKKFGFSEAEYAKMMNGESK